MPRQGPDSEESKKSSKLGWIALIVFGVVAGVLILMQRHTYIERDLGRGSYVLRIDRLTGEVCFLPELDGRPGREDV